MSDGLEPHLRLAQVSSLPLPGRWQRLWRRIRTRHLRDPLVQSILALAGALGFGAVGLLLSFEGWMTLAAVSLALAGIQMAVYASIVFEALKSEKAIQYWRERRDLDRRLSRERLHRSVLATSLDRVLSAEGDPSQSSWPQLQVLLAHLTAEVFQSLVDRYADVAVVVTHEEDRYCLILRSAHSRGSRWHELEEGKRCEIEVSVEHKLSSLADFHHTVTARSASGWLRLSVLTDDELHPRDVELVEQMSGCIRLAAVRWEAEAPARLGEGGFARRPHASSGV